MNVILFFKSQNKGYSYVRGGKTITVAPFSDKRHPAAIENKTQDLFADSPDLNNNKPVATKQPEVKKMDVTGLSSKQINIAYSKLFKDAMSISDFKAKIRSGSLNDQGEKIMQALAESDADDKAEKKTKNDAWKEKNLPKLINAKRAREDRESALLREKIEARGNPDGARTYLDVPFSDKERAKSAGARWDADKKKWYHTHIETPSALSAYLPRKVVLFSAPKQPAEPRVEKRNVELPRYGTVSEDDPSLYGSWLLGHEGESWASVRHLAQHKS